MSAKADDYYYNQLNKEQKKVYYAMKEGMLKMQDSFPVLKLSNKELSDIYFMIRMDCPEIFYSVKFSYRYYLDSTMVEFVPEYLYEGQDPGAPAGDAIECKKAGAAGGEAG